MKPLLMILWSRRLVILAAMTSSLLGGIFVLNTALPVYRATSRVVLEIVKPDPITGAVVGTKQFEAYVSSQMSLIRDYQVAGRAVERLGLADSPEMQFTYALRPSSDGRSFPEWIAERVIRKTSVSLLRDTNVLEISYRADTPDGAAAGAAALRDAYAEAQAALQRDGARGQLESLDKVTPVVRERLRQLEARKIELERETGVMLTDTGSDMDNDGLSQLTAAPPRAAKPKAVAGLLPTEKELLRLDMTIASATASLGPNNPQLQAMMQRRAALAAQIGSQRSLTSSTAVVDLATLVSPGLRSKMEKIIDQRVDATRVRMLQDELNLQRTVHNNLLATGARLQELSRLSNGAVRPLSDITVPTRPEFPRPEVIIPGTIVLGLLASSFVVLLFEFLNRRVRSLADLSPSARAPILIRVPRGRMHPPLPPRPKRYSLRVAAAE